MRKITSLLVLFCMFVGMAWGQELVTTTVTDLSALSNNKVYFIKSARCFLLYSPNVPGHLATSTGKIVSAEEKIEDISNPNQQFKIEKDGDKYYLYNVGAKKYVSSNGAWAQSKSSNMALNITNVGGDYQWKICIGSNGLNSQEANQMDAGIVVNDWTTADAGNCFKIQEISKSAKDLLAELVETTLNKLGSAVALQTDNAEGAFYLSATEQGDAPISKAIDGDPTTYYGSTWGSVVGHHHYWQVDLGAGTDLSEFIFSYITRAYGKDVPTKINVQGSTNGTDFEDIVVLSEGLPTGGGETYTSAPIKNNGYRYIRFEVPSTTNNFSAAENAEQEVTIAIAEFSLMNTDPASFSTEEKAIYDVVVAAKEVLDNPSATNEDVATALHNLKMATIEVPEYPFTITTDDNNPVCYAIKSGRTNDDKTWWYTYTEDGKIKLTQYTEADNQLWYFKHVKTNDYKYALQLFPKLGKGKVMSYQNTSNDPDKIVAQPLNTDSWTNYWTLVTTNGTEPYGFQTYDGNNYLSNNGGVGNNMGMWNASPSADGGTAMYFVNPAETSTLLSTEFVAWMDARPVGTGLGQYGRDEAAFTEAWASYEAATNFIDLSAAIDACKATYSGLNMPTPGKFYRIKSMNANDDAKKDKFWQVNETGDGMELQKDANYSKLRSIVYLNGDNNLISFGNGMFVNRYYKDKDNAALGLESTTWSFVENSQVPGTYAIKNNVNNYGNYYLSDWTGGVTYGQNDANAAWMIEEVAWLPIPVNVEAGWTSIYSPVELELSYNRFKAYTVSAVSETSATLAEQTVVPAGVGVVLEYQDDAEVENGCVFLKVKATETTGVTSALLGTYADEYISADAYVLGYINVAEEGQPEDKQVGFYTALKNQQEGASWLNNGFKAYLPKTTEAKTLRFNFGGETTAIETVETENANAPIYDLSGRRVLSTVKGGIYIQNGKKFIVK